MNTKAVTKTESVKCFTESRGCWNPDKHHLKSLITSELKFRNAFTAGVRIFVLATLVSRACWSLKKRQDYDSAI